MRKVLDKEDVVWGCRCLWKIVFDTTTTTTTRVWYLRKLWGQKNKEEKEALEEDDSESEKEKEVKKDSQEEQIHRHQDKLAWPNV